LLRRYGVMFRDLLANESAAPPWHELVRTYRRLEARGEIRGGRFVAGVAGEQYALPEVISVLRACGENLEEATQTLPATDPLNLTARITPGPRVPALPGYSVVIGGVAVPSDDLRQPAPIL
jgi:ATP-dependent Lhr-like helicase